MSRRRAISRGELEVARALWDLRSATVREVFESFPPERRLDFTTVQTYLRRLEAKGYLRSRLQGRVKLYSPRVPAKQVIRETVEDFMGRVFDGEALSLMQHLIREQGIGSREIRALREMLDQLEGEEDESAKQ